MIKSISLDSDNTLYTLGTPPAITRLASYLASMFGKSSDFWETVYLNVRRYVRANEWQTPKCYSIRYRLGILFRDSHLPVEKIEECAQAYYETELANTRFFPEVPKIIRQLRKSYKVGITTDSPLVSKRNLSPCLQKAGIGVEDLDFLILSDYTKRTGIPFGILIKEMQESGIMPYEIVHIGDDKESDINPAQNRGINAMLFDPRKNTFNELIKSIENLK